MQAVKENTSTNGKTFADVIDKYRTGQPKNLGN